MLFNNTKNTILMGASLLALNACLPDESATYENKRAAIEAKANYYAQSFKQYNNTSLSNLLNSGAWSDTSQALPEGLLNNAALNSGNAASFVQSAYCKDTTGTDEYHLSWFSQQDAAGDLSLKGLGAGNGGMVSKKINDTFSSAGFAVYDANNPNTINFINGNTVNGNAAVTLSMACNNLNIANGSAIIAFAVQQPVAIDTNSTEVVTRTVSCPAGEIGAQVESINVTIADPNNAPDTLSFDNNSRTMSRDNLMSYGGVFDEFDGGEIISSNCFTVNQVADQQIDPITQTIDYITISSTQTDALTNALNDNLTGQDCLTVTKKKLDENGKVETDENGNPLYEDNYDTCGSTDNKTVTEADTRTTETSLISTDTETITAGCGTRQAASSTTHLGKAASFVTRGAYTGSSTLTKTTNNYESVELVNGVKKNRTRKKYANIDLTGNTLDCRATDVISIACNTIYTLPSGITASGTAPRFKGTTTVSGWANPATPTPNDETYGTWSYVGGSMNCSYADTRSKKVACGSGYRQSGKVAKWVKQERIAKSTNPSQSYGSLSWGDWETTATIDASSCGGYCPSPKFWKNQGETEMGNQSNVWICVYPNGVSSSSNSDPTENYTASNGEVYSSYNEAETYGGGSTGRTTESATSRGSTSIQGGSSYGSDTSSSNSGSSSSSGGGSFFTCFLENTQIAMADGSYKNIQDIKVGDITMTGRALQTHANPYGFASDFVHRGDFMKKGIYDFDGIKVTGEHVIKTQHQWIPIYESGHAKPDFSAGQFVYYNLMVENALIPVQGQSGKIHYFADTRNNQFGESEKGYAKLNVSETRSLSA